MKSATATTVQGEAVISRSEIMASLKHQMPCADVQDIRPFVDMLCADKASVTLDALLLNAFSAAAAPVAIAE